MSDTPDLAARVERVERIVVARSHRNDTPEVKEAVAAIVDDLDTTPNVDGHSPKMLRDWTAMQDDLIAAHGMTRSEADHELDDFFGKIERGELVADGTGNWTPPPAA